MSSQIDKDEVVLLVRSVVAAKKSCITLKELTTDYYECNGTPIPFRQLGFSSLLDFLQSQPDKFVVQKTLTDITVKAVVDASIGQICRLVQGQKSQKKKKSKAKTSYYASYTYKKNYAPIAGNFNRYNNGGYQQNRPAYNKFAPQQRPVYENRMAQPQQKSFYDNFPTQQAPQTQFPRPPVNSTTPAKRPPLKTMSENVTYHASNLGNKFNESKLSNRSLATAGSNGKRSDYGSTSNLREKMPETLLVTDIEDRWVNASYYLREHPVTVTCILSCDKIYLRLVGPQFSEAYTQLKNSMDTFYRTNAANQALRHTYYQKDLICVASDKSKSSFYRVQIVKKEAEDVYSCNFVDEGVTRNLRSASLYKIQEQFLQLKFQAVRVNLAEYDKFGDNPFVKESLTQMLLNKEFIAKRATNDLLTVALFDGNQCVTQDFFAEYRHFTIFKPAQYELFFTMLTYIDSDSALAYVEVPNEKKERFDEMMSEMNEFYNCADQTHELVRFKSEFNLERDANSLICCAKYPADSIWYRVKILRACPGEKYMAHFIDFGNRELVSVSDFRLIPEKMDEFKFMPAQALPVSVISNQRFSTDDLGKLYTNYSLHVRVLHINAAGLPSVEIIGAQELLPPTPPPAPVVHHAPESNKVSDEIANKLSTIEKELSKLKLSPVERTVDVDEAVIGVKYQNLTTPDLPSGTNVYVTYVNNPFDFVVNLEMFRKKFQELKVEMKEFYATRKQAFKASENLEKDCIYVYCDGDLEYHRVKFLDVVGNRARIQDIDNGYYDAAQMSQIFLITNRFLEMPPLAIKCRMANLTFDSFGAWSENAIGIFKQLTQRGTFKASIFYYDCLTDYFKVELNAIGDQSIIVSHQLLKMLAK